MDPVTLVILVALVGGTAFVGIRYYSNIAGYLEEVNKEMRKVSWPSRSELISNTIITLVATLIISLFIFGADRIISTVLKTIYGS